MEKYSKAVSEMYSQFKKKEDHPMEKYIGRNVQLSGGEILEVVGYATGPDGSCCLIVDSSQIGGMKLVSMGDGLENVSSKIWEEKVWKH